MDYEKRVHNCMREIAAAELAQSAHDLSDGGLAVTLSESCTSATGADVKIETTDRPEFALFGESPSRILISTNDAGSIQKIAAKFGIEAPVIGVTIKERLKIGNRASVLINLPVIDLKSAFEGGLLSYVR
jgi:phosphoribosylformylglycinamidine (FGAM) synthase-like enzyme